MPPKYRTSVPDEVEGITPSTPHITAERPLLAHASPLHLRNWIPVGRILTSHFVGNITFLTSEVQAREWSAWLSRALPEYPNLPCCGQEQYPDIDTAEDQNAYRPPQSWRPNFNQGPRYQGPTRTQQVFASHPPNYNPRSNIFKIPPRNVIPSNTQPMSGVSQYNTKQLPPSGHDWTRHDFILTTDASNLAIGAVFSQGVIGSDKPIAYASRTLNTSEINYSTIEKELLAIVWATKYFCTNLFGRTFKIITDHKPLQWVMNLKESNSRGSSTLLEHLRILSLEQRNEPVTNLMPYAVLGYNSSIHSFTRCRPLELITGHFDPRDPSDIHISEHLLQQYVQDHKKRMTIIYDMIYEPPLHGRTELTEAKNKNREPEKVYTPDPQIFISNPTASSHKLAPRYTKDTVLADLPIHIYTKKKRDSQLINEIIKVLAPVKLSVEALCRSDANLCTADATLKFLFQQLCDNDSIFASKLKIHLLNRMKDRRRNELSGVLNYLQNPHTEKTESDNLDTDYDVKELFSSPSKMAIKKQIISLTEKMGKNYNKENDMKMEATFFDFDQYRGTGTLNELLDILFEDEEEAGDLPIPESIYVAPSDSAVLTDEDSGSEDSGGRTENLNARQLTAQAEVTFSQSYQASNRNAPRFDDLCGKKPRTWIDGDLEPFLGPFPEREPIRFGYKVWSLCTPDGYLINFDVYQGKSPNANSAYEQHFRKCADPVLTLVDEFPNEKKRMPYHFFFDNLFTSLNLLNYFRQQGYGARNVREPPAEMQEADI
ncbi:Retrovirus-related Pol polyprotein from transposon 297 [Eumeta japonica]|uniref:Retrovirus-related Pol polyprotein from transposon 297 n=1 Tax=Eumeta variegata TaxID=151549 RepID=A0A4C1ZG78_EUMVA|nr:Retrovirus-related Pol polyprotein from transposon 297 [Eumeta japonica]